MLDAPRNPPYVRNDGTRSCPMFDRRGCLMMLFFLPAVSFAAENPADGMRAVSADFQKKLDEYNLARQEFDLQSSAYWSAVAQKRRQRNQKRSNGEAVALEDYVLDQPPVYGGPPKPVDPAAPAPEPPSAERRYIPVVADFLRAAEEQFDFSPRRPENEAEYRKAYAKIASAAGLGRDQAVRIYAFESGGNGGYDVQAGLEQMTPTARAISTALGYNQLLATNSVESMAEQGDQFIKALQAKRRLLDGSRAEEMDRKIEVVRRMVAFSRSVPDSWTEHDRLANLPKGLAIHAMNLDVDVGPLLQVQKLMDSVTYARRKGFAAPLGTAELEMMNLTGDGNGFDVLTMTSQMRQKIPTANLFQRQGYERNSIAVRNNVVAALVAAIDSKMDDEAKLLGARELAAAFAGR